MKNLHKYLWKKERKKDERRAHFIVGKSRVQKALSMKTMTKLQFKENRKNGKKGPGRTRWVHLTVKNL